MHAYDMLEHSYLGHWWVDGRKPYMVYTQTGGTSYAGENAAFSGWTDREWSAANCDSPRVRCDTVTDPAGSITEHQYRMMYDDAHADWRYRRKHATLGDLTVETHLYSPSANLDRREAIDNIVTAGMSKGNAGVAEWRDGKLVQLSSKRKAGGSGGKADVGSVSVRVPTQRQLDRATAGGW